jgi:hypothetical protein
VGCSCSCSSSEVCVVKILIALAIGLLPHIVMLGRVHVPLLLVPRAMERQLLLGSAGHVLFMLQCRRVVLSIACVAIRLIDSL